MSLPSLSICITVMNEVENIPLVAADIPQFTEEQEIIFVDGHSTDGTVEAIELAQQQYPEKNIRLLVQPGKGQGDAMRYALSHATGELLVVFDGDYTLYAKDIEKVAMLVHDGTYGFANGNRLAEPELTRAMPYLNRVGNRFFAILGSMLAGARLRDILSGIKVIRRDDFKRIEETWGFLNCYEPWGDLELLCGAVKYKLKVGECPISYRARSHGTTNLPKFSTGWIFLRVFAKAFTMKLFRRL